jgi:hypothetical protein
MFEYVLKCFGYVLNMSSCKLNTIAAMVRIHAGSGACLSAILAESEHCNRDFLEEPRDMIKL